MSHEEGARRRLSQQRIKQPTMRVGLGLTLIQLVLLCGLASTPTDGAAGPKSLIFGGDFTPKRLEVVFDSRRVYPALDIAKDKIYRKNYLVGYNISIQFKDSKCSTSDAMNEAIEFYMQRSVSVFFGPVCDFAAAPVARQTKYWNIPLVNCGCDGLRFLTTVERTSTRY